MKKSESSPQWNSVCPEADTATLLRPIALSSSDVSSFTPDGIACQFTWDTHRLAMHTQVINMAQSESLPQWSSVRPEANTACHRVGSSAMQHSCDDAITCSIRLSVTVRSQLNLQMRPRCLQQQTSQGKRGLLVLCYGVCVIDCWHLQKEACQKMNASLRTENHGEKMAPYKTPQIFTTPS